MIQIRPITLADTAGYFRLISSNRKRLKEYFPVTLSKADTPENTAKCIEHYLEQAVKEEQYVFLIINEEQQIGVIILKEIDHRSLKCEFAWFIDGAHEGKGLASMAVQQALTFLFNELQFNKAFCLIPVANKASVNIAERNGFQLEGTLKENFRMSDASFSDVFHYSLLRAEWRKMKK